MGYYIGGVFYPLSGSQTVAVSSGQEAGILASYTPSTLHSSGNVALARVGVSWSSADRACSYAQAEIPGINPSSFAVTRATATKKWDQTLGTISIDTSGVSNDFAVLFYSSLYRSYLSPMNITGDNPLWQSTEPYYDSFYCICRLISSTCGFVWLVNAFDFSRGFFPCGKLHNVRGLCRIHLTIFEFVPQVHPLYAITQRSTQAEIVRALIEIYRHEGFLPDCRMSLDKGYTQGVCFSSRYLCTLASLIPSVRDQMQTTYFQTPTSKE
jgi:putative alpha-1,2-mannosidase